jgi:hypothetical protein
MSQNWIIFFALSPIIIFDAILVLVILPRWIRSMWLPLEHAFPPVEPEPDAIRRNYQSFKIDLLNLGWSMHVAADSRHLHLSPARLMRFFGATPISIPWDQMQPTRRGARVGRHTIIMPAWLRPLIPGESAEAQS